MLKKMPPSRHLYYEIDKKKTKSNPILVSSKKSLLISMNSNQELRKNQKANKISNLQTEEQIHHNCPSNFSHSFPTNPNRIT